ncbi:MAG: LysE family transporter, partial [Lentimicrobium sp.]|nr:LysE family transporter [Lentimicrobium sp.]
LISYGIIALTRKIKTNENGDLIDIIENNRFKYLIKGFFLNITNPFVWIFWMTLTVGVTSNYGENTAYASAFFAGTLFTILTTDIIKVSIAKILKGRIKPLIIRRLNQVVGILLIGFGVIMFVRTLTNFYFLY